MRAVTWFRRTPLDGARWVVIDCETSGLDAARDRLLSVGAVAVRNASVELQDFFQGRVQQAVPSGRENILIHGIGADAQREGRPLVEVIDGLRRFLGDGLPVAFHAPFDAEVLRRHGLQVRAKWLDLAALAPALFPDRKAKLLDGWLAEFGIPAEARHDALGDAFATAQLLLVMLAEAKRQRVASVEALRGAATSRFLRPRPG
jgi:DNA polymerase III subunit epsilon